jgi:hypothetical protein
MKKYNLSTRIKEFSMQVGKDYYDQSAQNQQLASAVEVCSCPRGYSGTSCEVI